MAKHGKLLEAQMDHVLADVPPGSSKSERIRQLARAGFERADIARHIGVRYQFVHNVISAAGLRMESCSPADSSRSGGELAEDRTPTAFDPAAGGTGTRARWHWTTLDAGGRLDLPAYFLAALGVSAGDALQLELSDDAIVIRTRDVAMRQLRQLVAEQMPGDRNLVDELIEDRRAEASRERDNG